MLEGSMNLFSETYIRFILSKLADECHFPEILNRTKDELKIRINCPGEDDIILTLNISNWVLDVEEIIPTSEGSNEQKDAPTLNSSSDDNEKAEDARKKVSN